MDSPTFVLDEEAAPTTNISGTIPDVGDDEAMVLVPATTFPTQGTLAPSAPGNGDDDGDDDEKKGRGPDGGGPPGEPAPEPTPSSATTSVPAFLIDVYEVSARAYAACVAEGKCSPAKSDADCTVAAGHGDHPANCVSIDQARAFCAARGKRLVKNDEWTAAAAGSTLRPYPWGEGAPTSALLNMSGEADGFQSTAPRGSFPSGRSPEGAFDLAGNVAEWVDVAGTNITRGGSHRDDAASAVSSLGIRAVGVPDATVGFRCAKDQ